MSQANIPAFETKRLILKGVTLEDAPFYQRHFCDYEVIRNLATTVPWPYPEDGAYNHIKNRVLPNQGVDRWVWGIFERDRPLELIGVVGLWRVGKPENRGFWLGRKFWGKGIMAEAVTPVMNYAFGALGFEKLIFANAVGNIGSRRVKEKTGATLLRVELNKFVDPAFTHHEVWELTKDVWNRTGTALASSSEGMKNE